MRMPVNWRGDYLMVGFMKKKGMMLSPLLLALIVGMLLLGIVGYYAVLKPGQSAGRTITKKLLEQDFKSCVRKTNEVKQANADAMADEMPQLVRDITDTDGDGAADGCDPCPNGAFKDDKDKDGMPDQCDEDEDDPKKYNCKIDLDKVSGLCMA